MTMAVKKQSTMRAPVFKDSHFAALPQVFAGSLYGTDEASDDVSSIRSFLGLSLPIPRSEGWNKLFEQKMIDTDGFVKRQHRARVAKEDAALVRQASPFAKSPVSEVRQLCLGVSQPYAWTFSV